MGKNREKLRGLSEVEELASRDKVTREEVMDVWNRIKSPLVSLYVKILEVCKRSGLRDTFCDIMSDLVYTKTPEGGWVPHRMPWSEDPEDQSEITIILYLLRIPWGRQEPGRLFKRYNFLYYMWELHGEYYLIDYWKDGRSKFELYTGLAHIICFEELESMSKKVEGIEGIKEETKITKHCIHKYVKNTDMYEEFRVKDR